VYYYGKRTALDLTTLPSTEVDMDAFVDLNLGVDYKLTDQFSVFLSLTNLLNQQYQRYYHYPVNGIQIMGGLMYKF
jgi:outer membrane cobalamin receptor